MSAGIHAQQTAKEYIVCVNNLFKALFCRFFKSHNRLEAANTDISVPAPTSKKYCQWLGVGGTGRFWPHSVKLTNEWLLSSCIAAKVLRRWKRLFVWLENGKGEKEVHGLLQYNIGCLVERRRTAASRGMDRTWFEKWICKSWATARSLWTWLLREVG